MDFILPSDGTMELMREEFAKLKRVSSARTFALSDDDSAQTGGENPSGATREDGAGGAYIGSKALTMLLLLYFVKHLGYNSSYGTQIFNTHRGMEQIRPYKSNLEQLNCPE